MIANKALPIANPELEPGAATDCGKGSRRAGQAHAHKLAAGSWPSVKLWSLEGRARIDLAQAINEARTLASGPRGRAAWSGGANRSANANAKPRVTLLAQQPGSRG
jgi:hypothetical protein